MGPDCWANLGATVRGTYFCALFQVAAPLAVLEPSGADFTEMSQGKVPGHGQFFCWAALPPPDSLCKRQKLLRDLLSLDPGRFGQGWSMLSHDALESVVHADAKLTVQGAAPAEGPLAVLGVDAG